MKVILINTFFAKCLKQFNYTNKYLSNEFKQKPNKNAINFTMNIFQLK